MLRAVAALPLLALLAACGGAPARPARAVRAAECVAAGARFIPVDGGALHVAVYGGAPEKDVVVLVHGWAHDGAVFYQQVAALRERFAVVTYDLRGHGDSPDTEHRGGDVAVHAADLQAMIEAIGRPVHLVGHDLGAQIALRTALDAPKQVLTLTLLSPALELAPPIQDAYRELAAEHAADPDSYRSWSGRLVVAWVEGAYVEAHPEVVPWFDVMIERHDHQSVVNTLLASLDVRFTDEELAQLKAPTLVVYGEHEAWPGADTSEARLAKLPGVTPLRIPGASHESYLEAADAVNTALATHLSQ